MPNWCENDLCVEGDPGQIKTFLAEAQGDNGLLDFHKFVPVPAEDSLPYRKWLDTVIRLWGTDDCNAQAAYIEYEADDHLEITFETAWTPPCPVVLAMSQRFPTLKFELRYFEGGQCFNGIYRCQGGEVTCAEDGPYFGDRGG
jgi:hypothetical protein